MTRPLRILNYAWHSGHQYELHKLPHEFTLVARPGVPGWKFKHRPLCERVRVVREADVDPRDYDAAILHFDMNVLDPTPPEAPQPFLHFKEAWRDLPRVAICHGTPPRDADGKIDRPLSDAIVSAVGDVPVVCNSQVAVREWGFERSHLVWHGFDPSEYPPGRRGRGVLTIGGFPAARRFYNGYEVYRHVARELRCDLLWSRGSGEFRTVEPSRWRVGPTQLVYRLVSSPRRPPELSPGWTRRVANPYARRRFAAYRALIRRYAIYLNPTRLSPMPRARAESMLSGLAVVTTNYNDESRFLENEVDGFYSNDPEQLVDYLRHLLANPDVAERVGRQGRAKAAAVFSLERFHADWQRLLADLVG